MKSIKNQRDPIFQTASAHLQDYVMILLIDVFWLYFVEFSPKFHCFRSLPSAMDKSLSYYYFRANLKVYLRVATRCFEPSCLQQSQFTGYATILTILYCFLQVWEELLICPREDSLKYECFLGVKIGGDSTVQLMFVDEMLNESLVIIFDFLLFFRSWFVRAFGFVHSTIITITKSLLMFDRNKE